MNDAQRALLRAAGTAINAVTQRPDHGLAYPHELRPGVLAQLFGPRHHRFYKVTGVTRGLYPGDVDVSYVGAGGLEFTETMSRGIRVPWITAEYGDELIAEAIDHEVARLSGEDRPDPLPGMEAA